MMKRKSGDLNHISCIRSDDPKVSVKGNDIKERCRKYFNKLLNENSIRGLGTREDTSLAGYTFYCKILVAKLKNILARMKTIKATGPIVT